MSNGGGMKGLCDFYIGRAKLIGALYCAVPTLVAYAIGFSLVPFRGIYVFRLILSLVIGIPIGAYVNQFGLSLWLMKHRSAEGPATVLDGVLIGAGIGMAALLVPPLALPIATRHPEQVKFLMIGAWLAAIVLGGIIGGVLATIGRKHVERPQTAAGDQAP